MSNNQQQLIKQYFNSLVDQFITDSKHKDITIVFTDYLGGSIHGDTLGNTHWHTTWETLNGTRVPNSDIYKYTITFLNHYQDEERWRGTVAHEFAHLYLFSKGEANHTHDDEFYSKMDYFEDWLDKKWNLSPRKDKGGDWNQHVDYNKRKQRENQYPNQPRNNDDNYSPRPSYRDTPEGKRGDEFNRLSRLIIDAKTLPELEQNYQTVKNSSLYNSGEKIKIWEEEDIKEILDKYYNTSKSCFCTTCLNGVKSHQSACAEKCSKCSYSRLKNRNGECHNIDCENYCFDPKWNKEREEIKRMEDSFNRNNPELDQNKQNGEENGNERNNNNEQDEFNRLVGSLRNVQNLTELEKIWQEIKKSSTYSDNKYNWKNKSLSNKEGLDNEYSDLKNYFSSCETKEPSNYPDFPAIKYKSNKWWIPFLIFSVIIIGIWLIFKLFSRLFSVRKRKKRK